MNEVIEQKQQKPPGIVPKHVQNYLILGVSVLILLGKAGAALDSLHFQENVNLQAPRRRSTQNP